MLKDYEKELVKQLKESNRNLKRTDNTRMLVINVYENLINILDEHNTHTDFLSHNYHKRIHLLNNLVAELDSSVCLISDLAFDECLDSEVLNIMTDVLDTTQALVELERDLRNDEYTLTSELHGFLQKPLFLALKIEMLNHYIDYEYIINHDFVLHEVDEFDY